MKNITVKSRTDACMCKFDVSWIAISIASEAQWPELSGENRVDILKLAFKDIEFQGREGGISPNQAEQILKFVKNNSNINEILIHCDAGLSRSPAVAAAIANIFDNDGRRFFEHPFCPNKLVYNMVLKAADRVFK